MKALVVFSGESNHPLRGLLKPGFRHCAVVVEEDYGVWVLLDSAEGLPCVQVVAYDKRAAIERLGDAGYTVLETSQKPVKWAWPWMLANCVGMVKSVLGINAPLTWTPYQLYCLILKQQEQMP